MGYFEDIYTKRVNRYGNDYQSRLQREREVSFENYLHKSVYATIFDYDGSQEGIFEPYKQDETETLHYLLTRINLDIAAGSILMMKNKDGELHPWMVYWKEEYKASGYNKYIMLKMTHTISWKATNNNNIYTTWAYLYGQQNNMLKDELKSRSRSSVLYNENQKLNFFVAPANKHINKEDYFKVTIKDSNGEELEQGFRVTGFDILSTPGVEYISVDPMFIVDNTPVPQPSPTDPEDDYFWLKSGEYHKTIEE